MIMKKSKNAKNFLLTWVVVSCQCHCAPPPWFPGSGPGPTSDPGWGQSLIPLMPSPGEAGQPSGCGVPAPPAATPAPPAVARRDEDAVRGDNDPAHTMGAGHTRITSMARRFPYRPSPLPYADDPSASSLSTHLPK